MIIVLVAMIHLSIALALIAAFAPKFTGRVADTIVIAFTTPRPIKPEPTPEPPPSPQQSQAAAIRPEGAAAEAGKEAVASPVAAPSPAIVLATQAAAPVAGEGTETRSGASDAGQGTGAGGQGAGTGSGASGKGQGGGGAGSGAEKIGGTISPGDYPRESRDLRVGDFVVVALTVGTDGKVKACQIRRASRDAEADRITCRLATKRFRFRPATDARGKPVESIYGWAQRWFYPGTGNQQ